MWTPVAQSRLPYRKSPPSTKLRWGCVEFKQGIRWTSPHGARVGWLQVGNSRVRQSSARRPRGRFDAYIYGKSDPSSKISEFLLEIEKSLLEFVRICTNLRIET